MKKKILLVCNAGMSTSILVRNMKQVAKDEGKEYDIEALPFEKGREQFPSADVILIGPQVKFYEAQVKQAAPGKGVAVIPVQVYGLVDGKKAIELAESLF